MLPLGFLSPRNAAGLEELASLLPDALIRPDLRAEWPEPVVGGACQADGPQSDHYCGGENSPDAVTGTPPASLALPGDAPGFPPATPDGPKPSAGSAPRGRSGWDDDEGDADGEPHGWSGRPTQHLRWTWRDIIAEAEGGQALPRSWRDAVDRTAGETQKHATLRRGGNIVYAAAVMKGELGRVDWDALRWEYEAAYAGADFSSGGTIAEWVEQVRDWCHGGEDLQPPRPGLTPAEVQACRELASEIVGGVRGRGRRPSRDKLFHVLLCLRRLAVAREEFEASEDFLARRCEFNMFPTWEEQEAAEFVPDDPRFLDDKGRPLHPRHYPTAKDARDKLVAYLHRVCDMDGTTTGTRPFVRVAVGTNAKDDPRVIANGGKPVGSLFRVVADHPFWAGRADVGGGG